MKNVVVVRLVQVFNKTGDELVREIPLRRSPAIRQLRELFHVDDASDPMHDLYPIGAKEAKLLAECVEEKFDLKRYDYFLACHAA